MRISKAISTAEQQEIIFEYTTSGLTTRQIAERHGRTFQGIRGMLMRKDLYIPQKRITDEQGKLMMLEYDEGFSTPEIAAKYGFASRTVCGYLNRRGAQLVDKRRYSEKIQHDICERYEKGENSNKLADEYGLNRPGVRQMLRRRAVTIRSIEEARREHTLDIKYFDTITSESSWLIGFIMGDGNVYKNRLSIKLAARDVAILHTIQRMLKTDSPVTVAWRKTKKGTHLMAHLGIVSKTLVRSLAQYGVVPRKSFTAKIIGLEHDRHFWRGAIDGDGYLYSRKRSGDITLGLVGSKAMTKQFADFSKTLYPSCDPGICKHGNIWKVTLSTHPSIAIIDWLYRNCTIALPRKLERAQQIIATAIERGQMPATGWTVGSEIGYARRFSFKPARKRNDFDGKRMRAMRRNMCISQATLAELIGVSQSVIYDYEANMYEPGLEKINALCRVFNVTPADLLPA